MAISFGGEVMEYLTIKEAELIIGVSQRQIRRYLASGELTKSHIQKGKVMIDVAEVYNLRQKRNQRKVGK